MKTHGILIVEDEAIVAMDIQDRLAAMGYAFSGRASSAKQALELTELRRPDLVLMDIRLSGEMDGIAAAEEIGRRFQVPVIFLTAYSEDATLERAKLAAPFGYILKPFEDRELKSTIEIALYKHRTEQELRRMNRLFDVLSQVSQAVVRCASREELLSQVCRLVVERGAADLAWVGCLDPAGRQIVPVAQYGTRAEILSAARHVMDDTAEGQGNPGKAVRQGQLVVCNQCGAEACLYAAEGAPARFGFQSCGAFPLRFQGKVWGSLNLLVGAPGFFREREVELLKEVAMDISFALDKIEGDVRRKQAESALAQSRSEFKAIFDAIADAIVFTDLQRRIRMVNPAFSAMFGYDAEEVKGQTTEFMECDAEGGRGAERDFPAGAPVRLEASYSRKDGTQFPAESLHAAVRDPQGQAVGLLGIHRDITERRKAEAERERLQGQLLQAQKMESVGRLAGGVAHDFNNMLSVILGNAELALSLVEPAQELYGDLEEIRRAAHRSADITRQLLAFARKQIAAPRVLALNDTVSGMLKMLRRLIGEDIDLVWAPAQGVWPVRVDPAQIDQILANLLVNARDAIHGAGRVTIETANVELDEEACAAMADRSPGAFVMLAVSDDGCGMEQEVLEHLFEPFFTTKEVGKGTGLGLATVYGIVKQNAGFIEVRSEPGRGTTFKVFLPRFAGEAVTAEPERVSETLRGRGETILIVEDEAPILRMGKVMLERLGYRVLTADRPEDAIRQVEAHAGTIHLLITDVIMPGMNGRDLVLQLQRIQPGLRCLYMSGYPANVIAHHGVLDPGVAFIQKPFPMKDLVARAREVLNQA